MIASREPLTQLQARMGHQPALGRRRADLHAPRTWSGCAARVQEEHTLARRGAERLWELLHDRGLHPRARRADRQPGRAAGARPGCKAIYLSGWQVAADANLAGQTYPDQSLYPANSVPAGGPPDQQRAAARRPDRPRRGPARPAPTGWPRSSPTPRPASAAR